MKIEDTFIVQAPVEDVWKHLLDIDVLSQCIPGIETLEAIDNKQGNKQSDHTYRGQLKIKVGPIIAAFRGTARFIELDPPRPPHNVGRIRAEIEGGDKSTASKVKATFISTLAPTDAGTQVAYETDIRLRGRLAQFGLAIVRGTAKKMTKQFSLCLQKRIVES